MFFRLPLLFAITYYFSILMSQTLHILLSGSLIVSELSFTYAISQHSIYNLTSFFFVLTLSAIYFYQNKIFFYVQKNKFHVIMFAVILGILSRLIRVFFIDIVDNYLLPKFMSTQSFYGDYYDDDFYLMIQQTFISMTYVWLFIVIAIIFYMMVKLGRGLFNTPLVNSTVQRFDAHKTNYLDVNLAINEQDYRKLYAVIFASIFCCVANGTIWNCYFNILSVLPPFKTALETSYPIVFSFGFIFILLNYFFIYIISQRFFIKTYSWLPISSILMASALTLILFAVLIVFINSILFSFILVQSGWFTFVLLILLLLINYIILYYLVRFSLSRYFI